jgi:hypothetical protein
MLTRVPKRLPRVPFECEGHRENYAFRDASGMRLTDRASAAMTWPFPHYLTFLRSEAPVSCMRLLGGTHVGVRSTIV